MTHSLTTAFDAVASTLADIDDPVARLEKAREGDVTWSEILKKTRQSAALDLYAQLKSWRQVGETMGGLSAQRAWQISRGE
jgi:hypothetical protein